MQPLFQKITNHYQAQLPFVVFCKPNSDKLIGLFQKNDTLHLITDYTESGFAMVSFDGTEKYIIPADESDVYIEKFETAALQYPKKTDSSVNKTEKKAFELLVEKAINAIGNNEFKKVVLYITTTFLFFF